jgi:hypothetical protein
MGGAPVLDGRRRKCERIVGREEREMRRRIWM